MKKAGLGWAVRGSPLLARVMERLVMAMVNIADKEQACDCLGDLTL